MVAISVANVADPWEDPVSSIPLGTNSFLEVRFRAPETRNVPTFQFHIDSPGFQGGHYKYNKIMQYRWITHDV